MRRCKKDWADEEQKELMESTKTLHELEESWKNMIHNEEVDKSGDENPRVPVRDAESEGENDDAGMFMHSLGNPRLEKILEQRVMENSRYRARKTPGVMRAMQWEENRRNNGGGSKQVWMRFDGKSRPWDIGVEERGRELRDRWGKENGMAAGEVRLMAEGKKVLGNMRGGMGKKSQEKEGEEPVGIGWVGSSILGTRSSLVGW